MNYDFPVPPHYFKEFETPDTLQPPNLKRLSKANDHFYAFQGLETFRDEHERIFPEYLQLLPEKTDLSVPGHSLKANLVWVVEELHRCCTAYIRAFAEDPQSLKDIRVRLDAVLFNTFWLLKKVRVKLEAKHNLSKIYETEARVLYANMESKAELLRRLLHGPVDAAYTYTRPAGGKGGKQEAEQEEYLIHSEKSSMDIEHGPQGEHDDNRSQFGGSYSAGGD